jgi:hypothetical protein
MADTPGGVQFDAGRGLYFMDTPRGRNYISPAAFGEKPPDDTTGIFHSGPQWDTKKGDWVTPFDWGNLLNVAVGTALTAGAGTALAGGGAASAAGGGSAATAGGAGAVLPSTSFTALTPLSGVGAIPAAATTVGSTAVSGAGGGMGIMSGVKKGLDWLGVTPKDAIGAIGKGVGAYSEGQAENRDATLSAQLLLEKLLTERDNTYNSQLVTREQEGRAAQSDAWKKLLSAQHFQQPSARPSLSPYSKPAAVHETAGGADLLAQEAMARLSGGNPLPMPEKRDIALDPALLKAGLTEKTLGWLAPFLTALGPKSAPTTGGR